MAIYFFSREDFQKDRPDIELAFSSIDTFTREEFDYQAEVAVWYLVQLDEDFLWFLGVEDAVCKARYGCEPLGSEVGLKWSDTLLDILENDPEANLRYEAARALFKIGDPRTENAARTAQKMKPLSCIRGITNPY